MVVFFVTILGRAIMCVGPNIACTQIPTDVLSILVLSGMVELVFEIAGGLGKIYRMKDKDEDDK